MVEPTVKEAEELTAKEVHARLTQVYKDLQSWREKVLADPYAEAQKAGAAAAKPYYDGMKAYQARIQQYQGAAALAASQGNAIGGNQQLQQAHQQMAEAGMLKGTAQSLDGQVQVMNKQVPEYLAAAHWAAWRKMYETNPQDFPPPPASVNAFTPAPVAFLETKRK